LGDCMGPTKDIIKQRRAKFVASNRRQMPGSRCFGRRVGAFLIAEYQHFAARPERAPACQCISLDHPKMPLKRLGNAKKGQHVDDLEKLLCAVLTVQSCLVLKFLKLNQLALRTQRSVERQKPIPICFRGKRFGEGFRADLVVGEIVMVELKSVESLARVHKKQVLTYLKLSHLKLGLLINSGGELLKGNIERLVTNSTSSPCTSFLAFFASLARNPVFNVSFRPPTSLCSALLSHSRLD